MWMVEARIELFWAHLCASTRAFEGLKVGALPDAMVRSL